MDTTITSPTDAVLRLLPPSTLMHCTRRAPELSATSRLDSTWIIYPSSDRRRRRFGGGRRRRRLGCCRLGRDRLGRDGGPLRGRAEAQRTIDRLPVPLDQQ